jgi:hypothetical protein
MHVDIISLRAGPPGASLDGTKKRSMRSSHPDLFLNRDRLRFAVVTLQHGWKGFDALADRDGWFGFSDK